MAQNIVARKDGERMCVCVRNTCLILPFNFERKPFAKATPAIFKLNVYDVVVRAWVASVHSFARNVVGLQLVAGVSAVYPQKVYRSLEV